MANRGWRYSSTASPAAPSPRVSISKRRRRWRGYTGVSSKNCKGFYKSILNAARVAKLGAGHFMSAEDLTTWPGVSVQQDLALVSLLGMTHVERNAHHFVDGMSFASEAEQKAFVGVHRDLYERKDGHPARLKAPGGRIALRSLNVPGFAVGAEMDFRAMTPRTTGVTI